MRRPDAEADGGWQVSRVWSRRTLLAAAVVVVVGGPTAVVLAAENGSTTPDDGASTNDSGPSGFTPSGSAPTGSTPATGSSSKRRTAKVTRRDLVRTYDASGSIGFGERTKVHVTSGGTVTDLPAVGSVIEIGSPVCEIDGVPGPILLVGGRPMWRDLRAGVDDGIDITQLELNLVLLGHAESDVLEVNTEWDTDTTAAVKLWQAALGRDETGRVSRTDVWFRPTGAARVAAQLAPIGGEAMGDILEVTGTSRSVHLDLAADRADLAVVGADVDLELVDGTTARGAIASVADVATVPTDPSQPTTVAVEIDVDGDVAVPDESPVTVHLVADARRDVLAVPVEAVVALSEGGYALEVVDGGSTHLVGVELGRFADGWVEVDGDVDEGQTVVTA